MVPRLARWLPLACTILAASLLLVGFTDMLPPKVQWMPVAWIGFYLAGEGLARVYVRLRFRQLGVVRCGACARPTMPEVFEVLGWCLGCGSSNSAPAQPARKSASQ